MLKKIMLVALLVAVQACSSSPEEKTPQTVRGQLNRCMFDRVHQLKKQDKLVVNDKDDKYFIANQVMQYCKRKLDLLYSGSINDMQTIEIAASAIDEQINK